MEIGMLVGAIIGIALGTIINGVLIFVVGKMKLGMEVAGFGSALLAGLLVAVASVVVAAIWTLAGLSAPVGLVGALINLVVAAAILLAVGNSLKGLTVKGWTGAIVAAVAIAALGWLIGMVLAPTVGA